MRKANRLSKKDKNTQPSPLPEEGETSAKRSLIRRPLDTLSGLIAEATRVYRQARDKKLDHARGPQPRVDAGADESNGRNAGSGAP